MKLSVFTKIKMFSVSNSKNVTKFELVKLIFKPDEEGNSEWKTREELDNTLLKLGNNGNVRHGVLFGVKQFIWDIKKKNDSCTGKVEKVRTIGINKIVNDDAPIGKHIRDFYKDKPCVVCSAKSSIVMDHKNDLYNDKRVLHIATQLPTDFQPLCNACNLRKREVCKKSKQMGKRFGATNIPQFACFGIDFIEGDDKLNIEDPNAMRGTYWYDPVEFMEYICKHNN